MLKINSLQALYCLIRSLNVFYDNYELKNSKNHEVHHNKQKKDKKKVEKIVLQEKDITPLKIDDP